MILLIFRFFQVVATLLVDLAIAQPRCPATDGSTSRGGIARLR
jgi:hypothetical protein